MSEINDMNNISCNSVKTVREESNCSICDAIESFEESYREKIDYSTNCNLNDEDTNNNCWGCLRFCFPIGCMVGEDGEGRAKKIKVSEAEIVVHGTVQKPCFEIKFLKVGKSEYETGFSSYNLNTVFKWLNEEFEIVKECK